ncbi:TlyA family RNA methyltransferase [Salinarimonas ramus]|uniref:TlyA family rRNA (Cytidine-2'-O)-methyltransferase n=1 Tax=Salinarimonas ramus TaxID=690164 RepID=A0A917V3A7_9HYPH|nr:TlyA family RNA methyltransferase [Salinarimonas ramus]GGK29610.1 TlyA family rRNA (cytidine-2'-O)-methyltransferase [Salinarimonas ramus]
MNARRADLVLVASGHFESRAKAQEAIRAGLVTVDGAPLRKASETIPEGAAIVAEAPHPWVSRGGVKLSAALDAFAIDPAGLDCLDVGASTGGFTDVLLARGARSVLAIDVGRGQLHPRIAADPRVVSREGCDARSLDLAGLPAPVALVVCDVSFVSLKIALSPILDQAAAGTRLVALVKPQFEAGRAALDKNGIVRDEATRERVVEDIAAWLEARGWRILGRLPSPIAGGDGNRETLIGAVRD